MTDTRRDLVDRLREPVMLHTNRVQTNAERREAAAEIARLRTSLETMAGDVLAKNVEIARLREICLNAYACIDVLANGVGKIATPDGFFDLWNRTGIELEKLGGQPFKKRIAARTAGEKPC